MTDYASRRTVMVDTQIRPSDVTKYPIIDAMLTVPREAFLPAALRPAAYAGETLRLGGDRVVLDPRVFAKMLEELDLGPDDMVLDVGSGLGYSAAVMARMAEAIVALESDASLAEEAVEILAREGADNVAVVTGALAEGAVQHGPYDAIIVQGGIEALPEALADQVKEGGRIIAIFMDGAHGVARIGLKSGGRISWRRAFDAAAPVLQGFEKAVEFAL